MKRAHIQSCNPLSIVTSQDQQGINSHIQCNKTPDRLSLLSRCPGLRAVYPSIPCLPAPSAVQSTLYPPLSCPALLLSPRHETTTVDINSLTWIRLSSITPDKQRTSHQEKKAETSRRQLTPWTKSKILQSLSNYRPRCTA